MRSEILNCVVTRWLETTSILVVIERIYRYQFSNDLKNYRHFAALLLDFWYLDAISNVLKKKKMSFIGRAFLKLLTPKNALI